MGRYRAIWKDGELYAEYEGDKLVYLSPKHNAPKRSNAVAAPYFIKDIGEYKSPLDGTMITSRSQHREHMRQHDVIEVGNERIKTTAGVETASSRRELGETIKRHLEEVRAMPQRQYDEQASIQQREHEEVASLVTNGETAGFDAAAIAAE